MKKWLIIPVVLCCSLGGGWWLWAQSQPDQQVAAVKALIPKDMSKVPVEKRRETFQKVREEMGKLTPEQRSEVFKDRRKGMTDRMREYAKLTPIEKNAFLDKSIDEMDARVKSWRSQRKKSESNKKNNTTKKGEGNKGRRGSRTMSNDDKENRRRNRLDSSTPEERALFTAFIQDMKKRRQARGLPPFSRGDFGPPR